MKNGLIYIHGKNGNAKEAEYYKKFFPKYDIMGWDYQARTPWEAREEFPRLFDSYGAEHENIIILANSIGAFFTMVALNDKRIKKAYFISPIVNMERLILNMMNWAGISERELREKGVIDTDFGERLSWEYLSWVRKNPIVWGVPTDILYGSKDNLQSLDIIQEFANQVTADVSVTVMENGEHWFHTDEQMKFLSDWIYNKKDF